jgi:O-antigen ligase
MLEYIQYPYALLTLIAIALLLWRPLAGLAFLVAIFPADPWSPRLPVPGMNTETVLLGLAFAVTVLRFGTRIPPLRYSGPVFAFMLVTVVSIVLAIPWSIGLTGVGGEPAIWFIFKSGKSITFSALLFFATYWWVERPAQRLQVLEALSLGTSVTAIAAFADLLHPFTDSGADGRPAGLLADGAAMAGAVGSAMFISLYLAVYAKELPRWRRLFHLGTYLLCFLMVIASLSRGNWIALVVAHFVFLLLVSRRLLLVSMVSLALLVTVGFPLLPQKLRDRALSTVTTGQVVYQVPYAVNLEGSTATRIVFAKIGWDMFVRSPIWGHGYNAFFFRTPEFGAKYGMLNNKDPHNIAVKLGAESGLIGLAMLGWIVWAVFRCGRRLWRSDSSEYLLGAVLLAVGTQVLVASFSSIAFLYVKQISAYFWVLYAISARAYVERLNVAEATRPASVPVARWRRFAHSTSTAASQP